jgi:hypothetical protein
VAYENNENNENNENKMESIYSKRIRAGKRRTYFFDVGQPVVMIIILLSQKAANGLMITGMTVIRSFFTKRTLISL